MAELINRNDNLNQGREKLNEAIKDADKAKEDAIRALARSLSAEQIAQLAELKSDDTQQQLDNIIIESGTSDAETIQARGEYPLLKDRLNSTDQNLAQIPSQIENAFEPKADKTYVDELVQNVVSITPKIITTSASELEASHPNGSEENALVTDNGHIYYWNETEWVDSGVQYQSTQWQNALTTQNKEWVI